MPTRRDTDTLSRAEEEALARAKRAVEGRTTSSGRSGKTARRKTGSRKAGKGRSRRTGGGTGKDRARSGGRRPATTTRSATLDVLRGIGVVATVLLLAGTAPSSVPPWAEPSAWHGIAVADLVLPLFLLVAGASLAWADAGRVGLPEWRRTGRALRRVAVLVALGLALNWVVADGDLDRLRWSGLLQRIGLATFLGWLVTRLPLTWRIATLGTLVAGWGLALERVAAPRVPAGTMRPEANLVAWLDTALLGPDHLIAPTDPLGLATLPLAAALVIAGRLLGDWLRVRPAGPATSAALAVLGGWLVVLGVIWAQLTPLNATLWTPPYLLFATGAAVLLAAVAYLAAEVLPTRRVVAPLERLGRNALVAYLLPAGLLALASRPAPDGISAWGRLVGRFAAPVFGDLAPLVLAAALLAVTWSVVGRLDARGWHLRA